MLKSLWLVIKFSVFYIVLHVFVNMIFVHHYNFRGFWGDGGILGSGVLIGKFMDRQDLNLIPRYENHPAGTLQDLIKNRPAFLAFDNGHGYNLIYAST